MNFEKIDKLHDEKISSNKDKIYYICVIIAFLSRAIGEIKMTNLGNKITNISIENLKESINKVREIQFDVNNFQSIEKFLNEDNLDSFCKVIHQFIDIVIKSFKDQRDKRELCGKLVHYNLDSVGIFDNIDSYERKLKAEINKILKDNDFEK